MEPRKAAHAIGGAGQRDAQHGERLLVERARTGDADAFAQLIAPRADRMLRTAAAIVGSDAEAHDIAQDTLVAAWVHLPQLRDVDRFDAWIGRTLVNNCRQSLRRRRREPQLDLGAAEPSVRDHAAGSVETASIRAAFQRLSVDDQHILLLHHLHHLPLDQIARQLGTPVGTTKSRLWRARKALERALEAEA